MDLLERPLPTDRVAVQILCKIQSLKSAKSLAHRAGFEPTTPKFVVWCSIQLSYRCLPWLGSPDFDPSSRANRARPSANCAVPVCDPLPVSAAEMSPSENPAGRTVGDFRTVRRPAGHLIGPRGGSRYLLSDPASPGPVLPPGPQVAIRVAGRGGRGSRRPPFGARRSFTSHMPGRRFCAPVG